MDDHLADHTVVSSLTLNMNSNNQIDRLQMSNLVRGIFSGILILPFFYQIGDKLPTVTTFTNIAYKNLIWCTTILRV